MARSNPLNHNPYDVDELIKLGQAGQLTDADAREFLHKYKNVFTWDARNRWRKDVSHGFYTVEYFDSLARLFRGGPVLHCPFTERQNTIGFRMLERGIDWRTAQNLQKDVGSRDIPFDVVFMSWAPKHNHLDRWLMTMLDCPLVFLGQPVMNGSADFWTGAIPTGQVGNADSYYLLAATGVDPDFVDVPNWHGIDERTMIALPAGVVYEIRPGVVVAGPPKLPQLAP